VNGLGGGKISGAEINSIGVERVWDCDGEVGRAGEWKNEAFLRCDFLSFRTSANPSTSFCSPPPPRFLSPTLTVLKYLFTSLRKAQITSHPIPVTSLELSITKLLTYSFSPHSPKNVKSRFLVYITNYSLQPLLSCTRESDHPLQAGFRCFIL